MNTIYELLRRRWHTEGYDQRRQYGFSHEIKDGALSAWYGYDDPHDEDHCFTVIVCHIPSAHLQGLLQYIRDEQLAATDEAALGVLLDHLRLSAQKPLRSSHLFVLAGFPLLTALLCMLIMASGRYSFEDSLHLLILHALLIAAPLLILLILIRQSRERAISRALEAAYAGTPDEYCRQLHALSPVIRQIKEDRFWHIRRPLLIGLLAWLIIAVCFLFLP